MTNGAQAAMPVAVRRLEWEEPTRESNGCWTAKSALGTYSVVNEGGWYACRDDIPRDFYFEWSGEDMSRDTRDTAFAAAQSDYETRIRSALAPSDAMPVAWMHGYPNSTSLTTTRPKNDEGWTPLFAHPAPSVPPPGEVGELTIADYEEVLADKRRLTRELDIALHGEEGAAKQASLCDLIEPAKRLRETVTAQAAERDDYRESWKECMDQRAAAETALASARAEVERLRSGIADIEDAASSFCDESGDEVAGQIRIRARSLLEPSEEPK